MDFNFVLLIDVLIKNTARELYLESVGGGLKMDFDKFSCERNYVVRWHNGNPLIRFWFLFYFLD